ncbi:hypothetical protein SLEP1_g38408 [Rubroshorea leprosula]|nr:hypothetical protein SLEP1_g38408 [Rubroshorea leprosula]
MLEFVTGGVCENISGRKTVVEKIKMGLREKNYLLILDDVQNEQRWKWENLRDCLLGMSEIKGMNRVVVTTRSENVALMMGALHENLYRPKPLADEECWSLIKQRAFGSSSVPLELEVTGREIARKCRGVPLVANLIGGTLHGRRDKDEWLSLEKMNAWNSLERDNGIFCMLKLSFDRLPEPALKQCFAFCSIFPEDVAMEREMLIQLWMAEGFLQPCQESSIIMEDIGNKYFNDLLSYSLLQEEERDSLGNVRTCKMHNLVRDLALSVSKSEAVILETHSRSNISNVRHLNLICGGETMPTILGDVAPKLHTLFSKHGFSGGVQVDLKRLRALSFVDASDAKELPTCFGKSKSLRYLDISGTQIKELPKFVTRLYNLQTLRFMNCKYLKMLPEGIGHLINLKHIYFSDEEQMPAHIGRLTSLQTLQLFFVGREDGRKIEELGSLSRLKGRLEIRNLQLVKDKSEAMTAKLHEKAVDELELKWRQGTHQNDEDVLEGLEPHSNLQTLTIEGYGGKNLPSWMSKSSESFSLSNLLKLTIRGCRKLKSIPLINGLPSLQLLTIDNCSELTSMDDDGAFAFMSLTKLVIKSCPKLKNVPERGLSSLTELVIEKCDSLECVPVSRLSSLRKLHIRLCTVRSSMGDRLPTCLEDLYLYGCPNLSFIPGLDGLASLKNVVVVGCGGLEYLPSGLSSCTALEVLTVSNCDNLISIPKEVQELQSLVELKIEFCPKLRSLPVEILDCLGNLKRLSIGPFSKELENFPGLNSINRSLEELKLFGWETLTQLPHQIQYLTALKELEIWNFDKLQALPEWLGNLSSLQRLEIRRCRNLKHLPSAEAIRCLSKLKELRIGYCPELKERYNKESGPEWSKISHIPNVRIEYDGNGQPTPRAGQSKAK